MIDVEVCRFSGPYAGLNSQASVRVGLPELVNKALTVGGYVGGSPRERTLRRKSIASMVESSVGHIPGVGPTQNLTATLLYDQTETTEKAGISFRLGMAFAAVVAARVLGTVVMQHVRPTGGKGRRADLLGRDRHRRWHVIEAKARTHGFSRSVVRAAKTQAQATRQAMAASGLTVETASASVTDLSCSPIYVLLEDPPEDEGTAFEDGFDEERFFADYYLPVPDLLRVAPAEPSGFAAVDRYAAGAWLEPQRVWLGLAREILQARQEHSTWARAADVATVAVEQAFSVSDEEEHLVHRSADGHVIVLSDRFRGGQ